MPGLSGEQTLALMRDGDPDVQVSIVTGHSSLETAVAALRLPAIAYISKPFDARKVRALVKSAIEERAERRGKSGALSERDRAKLDSLRRKAELLLDGFRGPAGRVRASVAI